MSLNVIRSLYNHLLKFHINYSFISKNDITLEKLQKIRSVELSRSYLGKLLVPFQNDEPQSLNDLAKRFNSDLDLFNVDVEESVSLRVPPFFLSSSRSISMHSIDSYIRQLLLFTLRTILDRILANLRRVCLVTAQIISTRAVLSALDNLKSQLQDISKLVVAERQDIPDMSDHIVSRSKYRKLV